MVSPDVAVEGADIPAAASQPTPLLELLPDLGKPWWRVPYLLKLNILLTVPMLTGYLVGFDSSMLNGMQSVPRWIEDFHHPSGVKLGILGTMQSLGAVASLPFAPMLTDWLGRRHPVVLGSLICLLATGLQAGAINTSMFLAGRFFIGFGAGLVGNATPPLMAELAYPSHRAFLTSFASTTWFLGAIVAAWSTYGTFKMPSSWSWRIPSLLQCLPSIYQLLFIYFVPESPRWLVGKGRLVQARRILNKYHAGIDSESEISDLVSYEMSEIESTIELEKTQNTKSYLNFFTTKGNRWRFAIVFLMGIISQWAGNGLISQYLVVILKNIGITSAKTQNIINGVLTIFSYIVSITGASTLLKWGRKRILLIGMAGMFSAYFIWTILSAINQERNFEDKGLGIAIIAMIFVFNFFYNISVNPVQTTYVLEILPFTLRAKGLMITQFSTYGAGLFNGFVNPIAMDGIGWKYYLVYVILLAVWFGVIWALFPETGGRTLEEVSEIFDGPNLDHQSYAAGTKSAILEHNEKVETV